MISHSNFKYQYLESWTKNSCFLYLLGAPTCTLVFCSLKMLLPSSYLWTMYSSTRKGKSSSTWMGMVTGSSPMLSKMNHQQQLLDLFVQLKPQMASENACTPSSSVSPLVSTLKSFRFQIRNLVCCYLHLHLGWSVVRFHLWSWSLLTTQVILYLWKPSCYFLLLYNCFPSHPSYPTSTFSTSSNTTNTYSPSTT